MSPGALSRTPLVAVEVAGDGDDGAEGLDGVVALGVPVVQGADGPVLADGVPPVLSRDGAGGAASLEVTLDAGGLAQRGFKGALGDTLVVAAGRQPSDLPAVVLVGFGPVESVGADTLRRAAATFVRAAGRSGTAVLVLPESLANAVGSSKVAGSALAEGAMLGAYRFTAHKSEPEPGRVDRVVVRGVGLDPEELAVGVARGRAVADAVCLARDLVNEPPSSMTPSSLARAAEDHVGGQPGVTLEVWEEDRIAAEHLGGLLGVARGSAEPPRLLRAEYEPADPVEVEGRVPHVVLVGKGITFDSGGLSLKTADGMVTMKTDMSGAAAVLATVSACGALGVRVRVTAIAPVTENMPGGRATKPGDVLTIRNGRTIEVLNTDAEGRLVLADGLSLATELQPDAVIDLATLTGACVVALGNGIAGVFGSDEALVGRVQAASARAGESVWPLPLPDEYRSHIDSDIADMKNVGKAGQAGAIAAAMLLARFVEGVPWVHLDIAGPARADEDSGVIVRGGTGFGVRTLLSLLEEYSGRV
jgi:leucyl aminopeptidase